ncbi:Uu.00g136520.m01.CDS01 [Anthostomella pinea]|uniref:Uu.00g136520.m01.CDS01 n=1 Tax=Anthostomella pinea TaxID=933095 RepID=A0AAI8YKZ9_9PEZI|nr:Uu.00g136520.m01.CDS01 [Anthostomella pinea]
MSSIEQPISAKDLLSWDENQLVRFVNASRTGLNGTEFDISRVTGIPSLSDTQREELSDKLNSAIGKAGLLDADDLFKRLAEPREFKQSRSPQSPARSPTASPPPTQGNAGYEAFCYNELLRTGGRPAVSLELLTCGSGGLQQAIAAWVDDKGSRLGDGDVPEIISAQLEHWNVYQQRWQWDNRGKAAGEAGFPAYLAWQKKTLLHKGEVDIAFDPSFDSTMKRMWDHEPTSLEESGREGFAAYAEAVRKRLAMHHFTQPVRLSEDPCQQDDWTTWVEYLSYVYWCRDRHAAAMKLADPRYRKAWKKLESVNWSRSSSATTTETAAQQELEMLRANNHSILQFLKETRAYRRSEAACCREELRAQWVLGQLSVIEMETSVSETTKDEAIEGSKKKKRKRDDNQDDARKDTMEERTREDDLSGTEPQAQPKRRRQNGCSDTAPKLHLATQSGGGVTSGSGVVESAPETFKPRRSRRLGLYVKAQTIPPEPKNRKQKKRKSPVSNAPQSIGTQQSTRGSVLT